MCKTLCKVPQLMEIPISKCCYLSSKYPKGCGNNSYFEATHYAWDCEKKKKLCYCWWQNISAEKWQTCYPAHCFTKYLQHKLYSIQKQLILDMKDAKFTWNKEITAKGCPFSEKAGFALYTTAHIVCQRVKAFIRRKKKHTLACTADKEASKISFVKWEFRCTWTGKSTRHVNTS